MDFMTSSRNKLRQLAHYNFTWYRKKDFLQQPELVEKPPLIFIKVVQQFPLIATFLYKVRCILI